MLAYLYWEPIDWDQFDIFQDHREAIDRFAEMTQPSSVAFFSQSYTDLLTSWQEIVSPSWLSKHTERLQERYGVVLT